ncbi:MAG: DUF4212 domain-containing protein, partial [Desulfuromonadales bacterium]|nr:DUF4212 domain-containing protein [Desulfuromonadales bacterium]NIR33908.1 DUF4212 domain-containing protein [Desulfuromonadales bacterium]NIS40093.1 DUF4212 domain-containing protein [Desulfuromonadales bacterium]
MSDKEPQDNRPDAIPSVNFFRPLPGYMRRRVILTWVMLGAWALLTFGFQVLLYLTRTEAGGAGPLTERTLFGFPFHFLFTGQILIVCFIALCYLFNT